MKSQLLAAAFLLFSTTLSFNSSAIEVEGINIEESITNNAGDILVLNGSGLREKFWVDVYVGSLYLQKPLKDVADILSSNQAFRIQLNFLYKEVSKEKLLNSWKEGFEKNQTAEALEALASRIETFYSYFTKSALRDDVYVFSYQPEVGTRTSLNAVDMGLIQGEDFKNALLEIWLGNYPADKDLKKDMLGL